VCLGVGGGADDGLLAKKNDRFTTPPQQLHNTPSHGVELSVWSSPPCEEVLCSCCGGVV
jgi:hypothetical protein